MKKLAIVAGALLATAAATASAQYYRTYDPYYAPNSSQECWNPRAGHFEQVRPGEYQGDLDFRNCRAIGATTYYDNRVYERDYRAYAPREECWNPRARHYEEVRRGEYQGDLDFNRCRVFR